MISRYDSVGEEDLARGCYRQPCLRRFVANVIELSRETSVSVLTSGITKIVEDADEAA